MEKRTVIAAVSAGFDRDLEAGLTRIERLLDEARGRGAGLVLLPECALGGYIREPRPGEVGVDIPPGISLDGPEIARLARMAGDVVVVAGYTEAAQGNLYSSAVAVSGDGILGHQRKVHLPPAERFAYTPGDAFAAFDTPVGRVGILICYDKLFPEAARTLALDGAEIMLSPAAWPVDRRRPAARVRDDRQTRHFDLVDQARAVENQVYFASSNHTGHWGAVHFPGGAKVVDPDGVVLARRGVRGGIASAAVDLAEVADSRAVIDHLADRRPEAYVTHWHAPAAAVALAAPVVAEPLAPSLELAPATPLEIAR
jgi:predicted amidohydrolase